MKSKIIHGDCLEELNKIPDNSVDLVFTDPPYKLTQEYGTSVDADNLMSVASIMASMREYDRILKEGHFAIIFYDKRILPLLFQSILGTNLRYDDQVFFYRRWGTAHRKNCWMSTTSPIIIFKKGSGKPFKPDHKFQTKHDFYIKAKPEKESFGHPAQKPEEICLDIINYFTNEGDVIIDSYGGSGTIHKVALELNRVPITIESNKEFCKIIERRIANYQSML